MRRLLLVVTLAGGTVAAVYLATQADVDNLVPNRWADPCPVRVSDECRAANPSLKRYEALRFPVRRDVLADGGLSFVVPRPSGEQGQTLRDCIEVVDWADCNLSPANAHPNIVQVWQSATPFTRVRSASRWVMPDCRDGGVWDDSLVVDCRRRTEDGGFRWAGCNVMPRAESSGTRCLDAPSGVVEAGDRLEDSLE